MLITSIAVFLLLGFLIYLFTTRFCRTPSVQLPPGPPGDRILGHLRIVPADNPEYTYAQWAREYNSDVIYVHMLGQPIVALNSVQSAIDLLDKRGSNYCDRPRFVLFEVMGWRATLTFLRWGPKFKLHRKVLQRAFTPTSCISYRALQERETKTLLKGLLARPEQWETSLRRFATAVVMGIGFGIDIKSDDDPYIKIAEDASYALGHGGAPAGTPVDFVPFLRFLPSWFVRSRSLTFARDWNWAIRALHDVPFAAAVRDKHSETAKSSFIHTLFKQQESGKDQDANAFTDEDIKGAAGAVFAAGQDTTWATLIVFILNMVLHPQIQRNAQKQIDEVVGPDRLPSFQDRERLPYLDYIVQETLRWCPVSPIGLPHRSLQDEEYNGMFIPKGSYVYANARAMTHDERIYSNPGEFDPDRYMPTSEGGRGEPYPQGQFGFGRRVCVGKHLAEASVWIVVACLLSTMSIQKAIDEHGDEITPDIELTNGLTSHPKHFDCRIKPRSEHSEELISSL